jgi:hypothetical protein
MNYNRISKLICFLTLTISLFLFGCATTPVPTEQATPVPTDRIINNKYLEKQQGTSEVIVKRDTGMVGAGCTSRVYVDAISIADIWSSEKIILFLPDGDHVIGAEPNSFCSGGLSETNASVAAGKRLVFRISNGSNGDYRILPTAF